MRLGRWRMRGSSKAVTTERALLEEGTVAVNMTKPAWRINPLNSRTVWGGRVQMVALGDMFVADDTHAMWLIFRAVAVTSWWNEKAAGQFEQRDNLTQPPKAEPIQLCTENGIKGCRTHERGGRRSSREGKITVENLTGGVELDRLPKWSHWDLAMEYYGMWNWNSTQRDHGWQNT